MSNPSSKEQNAAADLQSFRNGEPSLTYNSNHDNDDADESAIIDDDADEEAHQQEGNTQNQGGQSPVQQQQETASLDSFSSQPSLFVRFIRSTFGFRKTTLTLAVVISYLFVILINAAFEKQSLVIGSPEPTILTKAWTDLQIISKDLHPFDSEANDEVHDYILERTKSIAATKPYIEAKGDNSTVMFNQADVFNSSSPTNRIVYFESTNVLVRVKGTDPSLNALLISAHYDSVSTSYGTTDDGMGIASMLGILEHLADNKTERPKRDIIFNFNNDEEFGLLGSSVFFEHPWSDKVKYFINLEGTGAGGRAVLFRATDTGIVSHYSNVRSPFANSLLQEGFNSGLIHSETDYKVYAEHGLRGVDIAFYRPRSLYHTRRDSIKGANRESLWHMESNALDLVLDLGYNSIAEDLSPGIFFDVLGQQFVYFSLDNLYILNIILLVLIPVISIALLLIVNKRHTWHIYSTRGWLRFPITTVFSITFVTIVARFFLFQDAMVISRNWFTPLIALASLFLIVSYIGLNFANWVVPIHDQKLAILLELNTLLWIATLWATVEIKRHANVGNYGITIYYVLASLSSVFGLLALALKPRQRIELPEDADDEGDNTRGVQQRLKEAALKSFSYDWSIQFLLLVPIWLLVTYSFGGLVLEAISQTIQESNALGETSFKFLGAVAVLLGLSVLPFVHKLNAALTLLLAFTCAISSFATLTGPVFDYQHPLKLRFVQQVTQTGESQVKIFGKHGFIEPVVKDLPSVKLLKLNYTCTELSDGNGQCVYDGQRPWLVDGSAVQNDFENLVAVKVLSDTNTGKTRYVPFDSDLEIKAVQNRHCVLFFNTTTYHSGNGADKYKHAPVKQVDLYHKLQNNTKPEMKDNFALNFVPSGHSVDEYGTDIYRLNQGIDEFQLHKTEWNQDTYHVGIEWLYDWSEESDGDKRDRNLGVTVRCYYGEYDGVSVVDGEARRKIPALDELLQYAPVDVEISNLDRGLVYLDQYVEL
ncbi:BA75_03553T0 [Komagataella pastoris]|uniref:Peptide hydrolase n=1 Tax=Komagataella pastoris TaxID=4922 RepID=A0A1B2JE53_PICPA|nr:BA75_03553T0 [Komagataella pastoris]